MSIDIAISDLKATINEKIGLTRYDTYGLDEILNVFRAIEKEIDEIKRRLDDIDMSLKEMK